MGISSYLRSLCVYLIPVSKLEDEDNRILNFKWNWFPHPFGPRIANERGTGTN
jgi:hypothetical protein